MNADAAREIWSAAHENTEQPTPRHAQPLSGGK
jgi:hypothetical protein